MQFAEQTVVIVNNKKPHKQRLLVRLEGVTLAVTVANWKDLQNKR